jgi:uncharacterized protein YbaR (Trm112 family)
VAARICPMCHKKVSAGLVVAHSDTLACPHCQSPLRVADSSRIVGAFFALAVGLLVWSYVAPGNGTMGWALPAVYTFLAYSASYTFYLMATGELVSRPAEPEPALVEVAAHGHAGGHH